MLNPLLEPQLRAVIGKNGPSGDGAGNASLDDGLDRLLDIADRFGADAGLRRTAALGLRGWSLACEVLDRHDLAAAAARRSVALAGGT